MSLSIVIPAFNEKNYVRETVETIFKLLDSDIEFEVIVVDNASDDGTAGILSQIGTIQVISLTEKVTVAEARNIGWRATKSLWVAFIDADMIITQDWANEIKKLQSSEAKDLLMVTGCKCLPSRSPSWLERVWFNNDNYRSITEKYINSGNLIATKPVLQLIGGFDESLITGEDVDFCLRAKKSGAQLVINRNFKIYHEGYPKTLKAFIRRERWHGVGDFSSWNTFVQSKVAICAVLVAFAFVVSAVLLFVGSSLFVIPLAAATCLIVFSSHYKFKVSNILMWPQIYVLQTVYFVGRALSIFVRKRI